MPIGTSNGSIPAASAASVATRKPFWLRQVCRSGSGKYHDALTRREAQVDKMLGKRTHLRAELPVSQGSPCCPRTRFGQRQALRAQLGGSRGERVEAESCDRMLAGKRVCLAHGSFFHHVSSVTLKSGAA